MVFNMEDFPVLERCAKAVVSTPLRFDSQRPATFRSQTSQPWATFAGEESTAGLAHLAKQTFVPKQSSYERDHRSNIRNSSDTLFEDFRANSWAGRTPDLKLSKFLADKSVVASSSNIRVQRKSRLDTTFKTPQSIQPNPAFDPLANTSLHLHNLAVTPPRMTFVTTDTSRFVPSIPQTPATSTQGRPTGYMPFNTGLLSPITSSPPSQGRLPSRNMEILQQTTWRSTRPVVPSAEACRAAMLATADTEAGEKSMQKLAASVAPHVMEISQQVDSLQEVMKATYGPGIYRKFKPADVVLQDLGFLPHLTDFRRAVAPQHSGPYRGDPNVAANFSANIPDSENCALWIMGLPANVNHTTLLAAIRDIGRIYAAVINPPTQDFVTAAAKLVFFSRAEAENMYRLVWSGKFVVNGKTVRQVRWNKIKSSQFRIEQRSRVIRITGPAHLMDLEFFTIFFKTRFAYELDQAFQVPSDTLGIAQQYWYFGSLRCQAESAKKAIDDELCGIFEAEYVCDPCGRMLN